MESSANSTIPAIDNDAFNLFEIPNLTGTPERRLLLAILERAVLDYVGNDPREAVEAEEWIFKDSDYRPEHAGGHARSEFSFSWVCDHLDLDRQKIASKIREMPKRGKNRIAPWHLIKHDPAKLKHEAIA
jgi:hypothetical protein